MLVPQVGNLVVETLLMRLLLKIWDRSCKIPAARHVEIFAAPLPESRPRRLVCLRQQAHAHAAAEWPTASFASSESSKLISPPIHPTDRSNWAWISCKSPLTAYSFDYVSFALSAVRGAGATGVEGPAKTELATGLPAHCEIICDYARVGEG